jgi:ribosomal-protein-alanine N-acetyltransferase
MGALKSAYLGYYAFKGSENKGLMAEGLGLVIELAFGELGLHRVEANIQPANLASIRLAQKVGLTKEGFSERYLYVAGQWRDHERWAMTAESLGAFNLRTAPSPPGDIQALGER